MSQSSSTSSSPQFAVPKLAATVLICRPEPEHGYKLLFVKRHAKARFMPGYHVFPGGIVENSDFDAQWSSLISQVQNQKTKNISGDELALRVASIREVFEESNVLLTTDAQGVPSTGGISPSELAQWREKVQNNSQVFLQMCQQFSLFPEIDKCIPWSRWITPKEEKYRYDTHFYLTVIQPAQDIAQHDGKETTMHEWLSPTEVIDRWGRGEVTLAPPTYLSMAELHQLPRSPSAFYALPPRDLTPIVPTIKFFTEEGQSGMAICFLGDEENEMAALPGVKRRLLIVGGRQFQILQSPSIREPIWAPRPAQLVGKPLKAAL